MLMPWLSSIRQIAKIGIGIGERGAAASVLLRGAVGRFLTKMVVLIVVGLILAALGVLFVGAGFLALRRPWTGFGAIALGLVLLAMIPLRRRLRMRETLSGAIVRQFWAVLVFWFSISVILLVLFRLVYYAGKALGFFDTPV